MQNYKLVETYETKQRNNSNDSHSIELKRLENLDIVSVDSLKYRIPIQDIEWLNKSLDDTYTELNTTTSEIDNDSTKWKRKAKRIYINGISTHYKIENVKVDSIRTENVLTILFNSKILGSRYFEGITYGNIELIYNKLIEHNQFKCSFESFMKGNCTDIDFKVDCYLLEKRYKNVLRTLKDCSNIKMNVPIRTNFQGKGNFGLMYNKREASNYLSSPFVKIYHKGNDLKYNSVEFKKEYFSKVETENIIRLETTLKNKKHLKSFGIENNELTTILSIKQNVLKHIIKTSLFKHINVPKKLSRTTDSNVSITDLALLDSLKSKMRLDSLTYSNAINKMMYGSKDKQSRYRFKKRMTELYHIDKTKKVTSKELQETNQFLSVLGLI